MSVKQRLVQSLHELRSTVSVHDARSKPSKSKAERVLSLLYKAALKQTAFTDEEKTVVGELLAAVIKPIQVNIESTANSDRTRLTNAVLVKRSALQFLIDYYASFPVGSVTLREQLEATNIGESVRILNDVIDKWCDVSDSEEGWSDREGAGASAVPASHTWWSL